MMPDLKGPSLTIIPDIRRFSESLWPCIDLLLVAPIYYVDLYVALFIYMFPYLTLFTYIYAH